MIKASGFRVDNAQFIAFTPVSSPFSPSLLLSRIMSAADPQNFFDGDISVFPLPDEVPAEIPRVQLKSSDRQWTLTASRARVGITWSSSDKTVQIPADAIRTCSKLLGTYFSPEPVVPFNRLALVINRAANVPNPAEKLIERFCRQDIANDDSPLLRHSIGFQLHNLKKYSIRGFTINSWVRCKTGHYSDDAKTPIVVFEQDLNIAEGEPSTALSPKHISEFFEIADQEAISILHLYFPEYSQ